MTLLERYAFPDQKFQLILSVLYTYTKNVVLHNWMDDNGSYHQHSKEFQLNKHPPPYERIRLNPSQMPLTPVQGISQMAEVMCGEYTNSF